MADRRDRLPLALVAAVPGIAVRLGMTFFQLQAQRKRGVRAFRRTLEAGGMPRDRAARLAQAYHDAGSILRFVRAAWR